MATQSLLNRVREQRRSLGMTIDDLSASSGVGTTVIKAIEGGHAPTPTIQSKIAGALKARVEDLFYWSDPIAEQVPA